MAMAKTELNRKPKNEFAELSRETKSELEDGSSLKGTLVSVFLLGIFLIVTWGGVFYLFLERS